MLFVGKGRVRILKLEKNSKISLSKQFQNAKNYK